MHAPLVQSPFTLHGLPAAPSSQMPVGAVSSHSPLQQSSGPSAVQPPTPELMHPGRGLQTPARHRPSVRQTLSSALFTHWPPKHSWQTPPHAVRSGSGWQRPRTHDVQAGQPRHPFIFFLRRFPASPSSTKLRPSADARPTVARRVNPTARVREIRSNRSLSKSVPSLNDNLTVQILRHKILETTSADHLDVIHRDFDQNHSLAHVGRWSGDGCVDLQRSIRSINPHRSTMHGFAGTSAHRRWRAWPLSSPSSQAATRATVSARRGSSPSSRVQAAERPA